MIIMFKSPISRGFKLDDDSHHLTQTHSALSHTLNLAIIHQVLIILGFKVSAKVVNSSCIFFNPLGRTEVILRIAMRYYYPGEFEKLMIDHGFRIVGRFGGCEAEA